MNYYELIYLKKTLKNRLKGSCINLVTTPYKNVVDLFVGSNIEQLKLTFSTSPGNIALYLSEHISTKRKNKLTFFETIYNLDIIDVELVENDRILKIILDKNYQLIFKVFSNKANVFLTQNGKVIEAFKSGDTDLPIPKKQKTVELAPSNLSTSQQLLAINPQLPRTHITELIEYHNLEELDAASLVTFVQNLNDTLLQSPSFRVLKDGTTTLFNEQILPLETAKNFDSINDLILYRYKNYSQTQRLRQGKNKFLKQINRQIKRTTSALRNLEAADIGLERAEEYEKYGHLLMANAHKKHSGGEEILVEDLYEEGNEISIKIDEQLSIAENAERYYTKSKNAINSYNQSLVRIPELEQRKNDLLQLKDSLAELEQFYELSEWEKMHNRALLSHGIINPKRGQDNQTLFHTYEVDGYTIWIGKSAKNNDLLVQMGHKEDVWLHARGVAGSHVLIRMANNKDMPPKNVIQEVASYAAFNSKAKGAKIVPVIFTKKKYVRKPKKAAPGAVMVEREEVVFITPKNPDK